MRIIEILDRSEQGITRPFLCRGEDQALYYVKGIFAGYHALCAEWCAGELARLWGLPIAPFALVDVPASLVRGSLRDDIHDLGAGERFGSQRIEDADELRWNQVESGDISDELRARLLVFDWWVANPDRMLSETGGNPNLLWSSSQKQLHIIDHNLAFSPRVKPLSVIEFASDHVFGADLIALEAAALADETLQIPPLMRAYNDLALFWRQSANGLNPILEALPEAWVDAAPDFTHNKLHTVLNRVLDDGVNRLKRGRG